MQTEAINRQSLRIIVQLIHHHNVLGGILTLHATLVEFKEHGELLAAKGGADKPTFCRRLLYNWRAWCYDKRFASQFEWSFLGKDKRDAWN